MLALQKLLAQQAPRQVVKGTCQVARMQLDQATGEVLNVGIVLRESGTNTLHTRFLRNIAPLRCLYSDDMAEDAAFLIDQAEQAIEAGMPLPKGWNVELSEPRFAQGSSMQMVLADLYQRLVPLGAKEDAEERLDSDDHLHATRNVRSTVRKLLTKHMQSKQAPEFWRSTPLEAVQDGKTVKLDIQIEGRNRDHIKLYGTIASAWYKSAYHRNAYLDRAAKSVATAAQLYADSANVVYLLKPTADDGFSRKELGNIESDVDTMRWLIGKQRSRLVEFSSETRMAENILADLGQI
jgi:hypothetical protein